MTTPRRSASRRRPLEWPTIALALTIYGGWCAATFFWASIPLPLLFLAGGWFVAWHGSLQHEVMHGHPTRLRAVNDAIGWPPLCLWLPYEIYRISHLRHHRDELLTDPIEDPESVYLSGASWDRLPAVLRLVMTANMTLAGRLTIGPFVLIGGFLRQEARRLMAREPGRAAIWIRHAVSVLAILLWTVAVCGMPIWIYALCFVYAGAAFTRLRSFAEHRYADHHEERTAIVENGRLLGFLYLNNNLHVLHHLRPGVPWYRLKALYSEHRSSLRGRNGGLVYNGYGEVIRRFLFSTHDGPLYPLERAKQNAIEPDARAL